MATQFRPRLMASRRPLRASRLRLLLAVERTLCRFAQGNPQVLSGRWAAARRAGFQVQDQAALHRPPHEVDQRPYCAAIGAGQDAVVLAAVGAFSMMVGG